MATRTRQLSELTRRRIQRQYFMEEYMKAVYIDAIVNKVKELVTEKCYGCQVDHPSQRQHNLCIMADWKEQVETCFSEALQKLDKNDVIRQWETCFDLLHPKVTPFEGVKWYCVDYHSIWLETVMNDITKGVEDDSLISAVDLLRVV